MSDKIEGVSKTSQSQQIKGEGAENQNSDKFQEMMDTKSSNIHSQFEVLDPKTFTNSSMQAQMEQQQTQLNEQDVAANTLGSATDEREKQKDGKNSHSSEIEEVSNVRSTTATSSPSSTSALSSAQSSTIDPSVEEIQRQSQETIEKMEQSKSQLLQANQANVEIKPSYQKLLKNHLTHIDDNIRIASSKVGVEVPNVSVEAGGKASNPVERFLSMLTTSQSRMKNLQQSVSQMAAAGKMGPGQLLAMQMKSNLISQEMELFSSLLGKALEGFKTIMNVQV